MKRETPKALRCAVYTRVSTECGLEQEFNSLDNQREAAEAYVKSQAHEARPVCTRFSNRVGPGRRMKSRSLGRLTHARCGTPATASGVSFCPHG
jgi:DNA invertase Pin-like site-specific DNA recombinase